MRNIFHHKLKRVGYVTVSKLNENLETDLPYHSIRLYKLNIPEIPFMFQRIYSHDKMRLFP